MGEIRICMALAVSGSAGLGFDQDLLGLCDIRICWAWVRPGSPGSGRDRDLLGFGEIRICWAWVRSGFAGLPLPRGFGSPWVLFYFQPGQSNQANLASRAPFSAQASRAPAFRATRSKSKFRPGCELFLGIAIILISTAL